MKNGLRRLSKLLRGLLRFHLGLSTPPKSGEGEPMVPSAGVEDGSPSRLRADTEFIRALYRPLGGREAYRLERHAGHCCSHNCALSSDELCPVYRQELEPYWPCTHEDQVFDKIVTPLAPKE